MGTLYRCALQLCNGRNADAEDLVQETALKAFRSRAQLLTREAGRGWLFRILTTTHLNRARSQRRRAEFFAADLDDGEFEDALVAWSPMTGPEAQLLQKMTRLELEGAVMQLSHELRAALWLTDVEEFSQREVASMLGIPEGTVASRVYRARRFLRAALAGHKLVQGHAERGAR